MPPSWRVGDCPYLSETVTGASSGISRYPGGMADDASTADPRLVREAGLTHVDAQGRARMVDVGSKESSHRRAVARCRVSMAPATVRAVRNDGIAKGDVLAVARIAGIQAAKKTADIIPLCHPLMLTSVEVDFVIEDSGILIESRVEVRERTGVEMEALHACTAAALTIYDMCKAIDREMVIGEVALWEKSGGRSGDFRRTESADPARRAT